MLLEWKRVGIMTYAGYILGFENDTPESIKHDLEIIKKELPLDMLEFFILTPLPGSEDHKVLWEKGVWMDPDMNKYDVEHVVTAHPKMTRSRMEGGLSHRLGPLLYRRSPRDDRPPRLCERHQYPLADAGPVLVLERGAGREPASAAMGHLPHQIPPRPALWPAARIPAPVLWPLCRRHRPQGRDRGAALAAFEDASCEKSKPTRTPSSIWTRR